jgi:hypothetical protein
MRYPRGFAARKVGASWFGQNCYVTSRHMPLQLVQNPRNFRDVEIIRRESKPYLESAGEVFMLVFRA